MSASHRHRRISTAATWPTEGSPSIRPTHIVLTAITMVSAVRGDHEREYRLVAGALRTLAPDMMPALPADPVPPGIQGIHRAAPEPRAPAVLQIRQRPYGLGRAAPYPWCPLWRACQARDRGGRHRQRHRGPAGRSARALRLSPLMPR